VAGRRVSLPGDRDVVLRPIGPEDGAALQAAFERLSPESRYRRFFTSVSELAEGDVRYLTDVDHHDHEALVALAGDGGDLVGVARFVRTGPAEAEPAIVVADDWQGCGLGTVLLDALADRAREEGIEVFRASVLAENPEAIRLLTRLGDASRRADGREVELEIDLRPVQQAAGRLRSMLRALAVGTQPGLAVLHRLAWRAPRTELGGPQRNVIVAAYDAGTPPGAAVAAAADLARALGAGIELVGVRAPAFEGGSELLSALQATSQQLLARGLEVGAHLRRGDPVASLVDVAAEQRARLIVVAATDRQGPARLLAGDEPYAVARHAPCDVLLVRGAAVA
jgi:nucleotide-binding universal stress UspA family protein/GNAT superfamily N-acetyltransferase